MTILVEFFGIPRVRTGVAKVDVLEGQPTASFSEVLQCLAQQFPEFADDCVHDGQLAAGYVASIDGDRFLASKESQIQSGQSLLILSSDAGG